MITPITRKELYLAKIIGEDVDIPETAKTREELFFLKILDNFSKTPEPITREELFLAKISGQDVELPEPKTRLELFLAKAAGMDVEVPVPKTREEIFWAAYAGIEVEIEGVPPLMFKSYGANLSDYRIYGNTMNGESVGNLVESGEHSGEYVVPVTINSNTTSIYLPHQIRKVGDEAEYIDYEEQKQHRVRKNLLKNTATSQTINGLTLTVNTDGSVTCNGRRENTSTFFTIANVTTSGKIILSGCPSGGSSASFAMRAFSATVSNPRIYYDIGDSCMLNTPDTYNIDIRIQSNYACNNLTFYPMIRKADIEDDTYEPYIENTDLDVTLPALPTLTGTNVLSVGTEVQPSKVYVKYKGERQ